jgi:membrane protease subunit HflK
MAWNEPGGDKDRDPWRSGDNDKGPPDLDEIVRNLQNKFGTTVAAAAAGEAAASCHAASPASASISC